MIVLLDRLREMWPISLSLRNPEFPYAERSAIFVDVFGNHKWTGKWNFCTYCIIEQQRPRRVCAMHRLTRAFAVRIHKMNCHPFWCFLTPTLILCSNFYLLSLLLFSGPNLVCVRGWGGVDESQNFKIIDQNIVFKTFERLHRS